MSQEIARIKDVCDFIRGLTYSKSDEVDFSSNAVLRATNIDLNSNRLNLADIRYIDDSAIVKVDKKVKVNDILICTASGSKSHLGKVALIDEPLDMAFGGFMGVLRAKPNINPKYLFAFFKSDIFLQHVFNTGDGANINNLKFSQFEDLEIVLPSLLIQQKIVSKLDTIFAEIDKATAVAVANANNAEALFQSYLTQVFEQISEDAIERNLSEISSYMGRGKSKHRPRNDESLYGGIYPFIQTGDVRNSKKYITSYSQTYSEKGLSQSKLWKANTVCITIAANIAEIGILGFDACFPDSVIGIVVDREKISEEFLYLMLLFQQQLIKSKSKGSAQENINLGTFEDMLFKIPPINQQNIIVQKLNEVRDLVDSIFESQVTKMNSLSSLKQSILKQALNGELVKE